MSVRFPPLTAAELWSLTVTAIEPVLIVTVAAFGEVDETTTPESIRFRRRAWR